MELELYFSCMIRKQVRFHRDGAGDYNDVSDKLRLRLRTVMTQRCSIHDHDGAPPVTDFPIERADRFIPRWLNIDYRNDSWQGEFGYTQVSEKSQPKKYFEKICKESGLAATTRYERKSPVIKTGLPLSHTNKSY
ncbi:MAG: hypothetical protein PVG45_13455 [Gammaproteobacteria bacterium]